MPVANRAASSASVWLSPELRSVSRFRHRPSPREPHRVPRQEMRQSPPVRTWSEPHSGEQFCNVHPPFRRNLLQATNDSNWFREELSRPSHPQYEVLCFHSNTSQRPSALG